MRPDKVRGPSIGSAAPRRRLTSRKDERARHDVAAVRVGVDAPERRLGLGREFADDLLEDVFERHQPLQVAILVHDEGDAAPEAPETQQLFVERRALGREERLAPRGDLAQALARQAARGKFVRDEAHVHDAVHAVEVAVEERHARMGRLAQPAADLLPVRRDVDAVDLAARHHHVLDPAPFEAEQRLDHALALGGLGDERVGEVGDRVAVGLGDLRGAVARAASRGSRARRARR